MVATDHCDYTKAQKVAQNDFTETPGGLPGVETLLPLMFTYGVGEDRLTLPQLVELLSANPARLWGMWPKKGALQPESDADIVVYDPAPETEIEVEAYHYEAGYTPYEGMAVKGEVRATISRGEVIYRQGRFSGREGRGRFVSRESMG
jgi:dihydropyrimidinase